jgi:transcriptional regulator with XRE-family HTH domain
MDSVIKQIVSRVANIRREKNCSAASVAALLEMEPTVYLDLEAGRRTITLEHLITISRALAVPLASFFDGVG